MTSSKTLYWLLVLLCLVCSGPGHAQQAPPLAIQAMPGPLLTDTAAALHDLFQAKRKSSGLFLAAAPLALGVSVAGMGLLAVGQLSGTGNSDAMLPITVLAIGTGGAVALLSRYTRYTKGNEREVLSKYQRTRRLPGWVARNLAEYRATKP